MLYEKIQADIKNAMLDKNTVKRDCLRSLISEIKNQTINAGKDYVINNPLLRERA